jgi:hypothetical protein
VTFAKKEWISGIILLVVVLLILVFALCVPRNSNPYYDGEQKLQDAINANHAYSFEESPWKIYMIPATVKKGWFHKTDVEYFIEARWTDFGDGKNIKFIVGDRSESEDKTIASPSISAGDGLGFQAPMDEEHPFNFVMQVYWSEGGKDYHSTLINDKKLISISSSESP